ncbi:MAG TPA: NAD(P)H-dependent oxidoreductase [Candidatus Solibacter sp.]|nr:NAD(P)H-dependent oxidoreductase [Candidatus Solibacter sp.]
MKTPKILVLAGSTRAGSTNRLLARDAAESFRNAGVEAIFADLRDYPMPLYDGDLEEASGLPTAAKTLKDLAREADAFAIASPEYNGSYSAVLKNTIDWMSRAEGNETPASVFVGKPVAILSASPGQGGGSRVLKELRHLFEGLRMNVTTNQVSIAQSGAAFDAEGRLQRPDDIESLRKITEELIGAIRKKATA